MARNRPGGGRFTTNTAAQGRVVKNDALSLKNIPARAAAPAPAPAPAPVAPQQQTYSAPYNGGGGDVGGGGGIAAAAPVPSAPSEQDYLAGDSSYQAQLAALIRSLSDYQAADTAKRTQYNTDYGTTLKGLGWNQDDPATKENEGAWNFSDLNTSAGRSFNNQQNDFAGRGLLQSSLYGTALDNLTRSLNDQLGGINTAKTNFLTNQDQSLASTKNQNTLDQQSARAEALARRAAQYSLT